MNDVEAAVGLPPQGDRVGGGTEVGPGGLHVRLGFFGLPFLARNSVVKLTLSDTSPLRFDMTPNSPPEATTACFCGLLRRWKPRVQVWVSPGRTDETGPP